MSRLKKFKTREEITAKIDSVLARQNELSIEADEQKITADTLFAESAKPETDEATARKMVTDAQEARTKQRKATKLLRRIPKRLEALKHTLAAFDTQPMPFVDGGVMMQK